RRLLAASHYDSRNELPRELNRRVASRCLASSVTLASRYYGIRKPETRHLRLLILQNSIMPMCTTRRRASNAPRTGRLLTSWFREGHLRPQSSHVKSRRIQDTCVAAISLSFIKSPSRQGSIASTGST